MEEPETELEREPVRGQFLDQDHPRAKDLEKPEKKDVKKAREEVEAFGVQ